MVKSLARLHEQLRKLPGIGSKTALRLAYHVLDMDERDVQQLAQALLDVKTRVHLCETCFNLCEGTQCEICEDKERDRSLICVVEQPQDVAAMERTKGYKGLYHVLHGVISPMNHIGPDDIGVKELLMRAAEDEVQEVIMATNPDTEGEATAMYISRLLKPFEIKVTRLAYGIPVGSNLEFADDATLTRALEGRTEI